MPDGCRTRISRVKPFPWVAAHDREATDGSDQRRQARNGRSRVEHVEDAEWVGGYFAYGGSGADKSATVISPSRPASGSGVTPTPTEETQFILSGRGDLLRDEGATPIRAGDVFVLPGEGKAHDLENTGSEDLRVIAFFSRLQVEQHWTREVWEPGDLAVTGTPNR